eukprot:7681959-Pyramimonas_sp.AAC.1
MGVTRGPRGLSPTRPARLAPDLEARSSDSFEQASCPSSLSVSLGVGPAWGSSRRAQRLLNRGLLSESAAQRVSGLAETSTPFTLLPAAIPAASRLRACWARRQARVGPSRAPISARAACHDSPPHGEPRRHLSPRHALSDCS